MIGRLQAETQMGKDSFSHSPIFITYTSSSADHPVIEIGPESISRGCELLSWGVRKTNSTILAFYFLLVPKMNFSGFLPLSRQPKYCVLIFNFRWFFFHTKCCLIDIDFSLFCCVCQATKLSMGKSPNPVQSIHWWRLGISFVQKMGFSS